MRYLRGVLSAAAVITVVVGSYAWGAVSSSKNLWPLDVIRTIRGVGIATGDIGTYDLNKRLIGYPGKLAIPCPVQSNRTAVLLVFGQSNAGNTGDAKYSPKGHVTNVADGKCYAAASPLLGSVWEKGEYLTRIADALISSGAYDDVVLIPVSVGNSQISRWQDGGDLNEALLSEVAKQPYHPTQLVWVQGERDFGLLTSTRVYLDAFRSMLRSIRKAGIDAPIYLAIATHCGLDPPWYPDNPVAEAQRKLVSDGDAALGVDMDAMLNPFDRQGDFCHLSGGGQEKVSAAFVHAILHD